MTLVSNINAQNLFGAPDAWKEYGSTKKVLDDGADSITYS